MAASRLAPHLSYKSALVILPPPALIPPIEAVRRNHDKHYARWPPHINLIYPFLVSPSELVTEAQQNCGTSNGSRSSLKNDIYTRISKVVKDIEPFDIDLSADPSGIFSHSKRSKTVWLDPRSEKLKHLQAALQAEFAECDGDARPCTPHLSIGQSKSDVGARSLSEEIKRSVRQAMEEQGQNGVEKSQAALDWFLDEIFVIERNGYNDRFKIIGSVNLGK